MRKLIGQIKLVNILSGDACSPLGLEEFEAYLAFQEHSLENLQFIVWYHDYRTRFLALPTELQSLSPSPLGSPHAPTPDQYRNEPLSSPTLLNEWPVSPSSPWAQWSPLPPTPVPLRDQPFRTETLQIVATFLRPNAKKELSLDADVRDELLRGLERTTHPDVFMPAYTRIYDLVEMSSVPNFVNITASNINLPKQIYWYAIGTVFTLLSWIIAVCTIYFVPDPPRSKRSIRLVSVPFAVLGCMQRGEGSALKSSVAPADNSMLGNSSTPPMPEPPPRAIPELAAKTNKHDVAPFLDLPTPTSTSAFASHIPFSPDSTAPWDDGPRIAISSELPVRKPARAAYRRPAVYGPERVVDDARVRAYHRAIIRDMLWVGFWWGLGIELSPSGSKYDISVKLLVDGKEIYKLKSIKKGQTLRWTDLMLLCDVNFDSEITLHIAEKHRIREDRVWFAKYGISEVTSNDEIMIDCNDQRPSHSNPMFTVRLRFFNNEAAETAYKHALSKAQATEGQQITSRKARKAGQAFKAITNFGEQVAGLDPTGSAMITVGVCNKAWEVWTFQKLKEEFDRAVSVQTLETAKLESERASNQDKLNKLKKLKPVGRARYDPTKACMLGTRTSVIEAVVGWARNQNDGQQVYWIHGFAGLGKSSIATSVCQRLDEENMLAACFFCKRDDPDLRDPRCVLNTIVYGLANRYKPYGLAVASAIQDDAQLCDYHVQRRYAGLVHKPMQGLGNTGPNGSFVVVVDALDECEGRDSRAPLLACLRSMGQDAPWLKLIVTSRPDKDIQATFGRGDGGVSRDLYDDEASQDIRTFICERMANIITSGVQHSCQDSTIQMLVERANGLFIWAATACKFVAEGLDVEARLKEIENNTTSTAGSHPLTSLDELYESAIRHSLADEREDNLRIVRKCLGAIVCTSRRTPLSVSSLEALLSGEVRPGTLGFIVKALGSVLYEDGGVGGLVRVYHPSFEDYLVSRSDRFRVDLLGLDTIIAGCCLNTMLRELRFNICGLETSYALNCDVPELDERIRSAIGKHIEYGCLYWSSHLDQGQTGLEPVLRKFLFGRTLLYWIEVLSLLGNVNVGLSSLLSVSSFTSEHFTVCSSCADDAYRFILAFYEAISESTPHLYLSALAFAPAKSEIAQRMRPHFPNIPAIVSGGEEQWSSCLRTISVSSEVLILRLTSDGSRIISGHEDGTVQVWDMVTGAAVLEPLRGELSFVSAIAVDDGNCLAASGNFDGTVKVWNLETCADIWEVRDHPGAISSVAFSTNGQMIASTSYSGQTRVWSVQTGTQVLKACIVETDQQAALFHQEYLYVFSFSNTQDGFTTYVWDGEANNLAPTPAQAPRTWSYLTAVSSETRCLVACSADSTIAVWDCAAGIEVCKAQASGCPDLQLALSIKLREIADFSPDGHRLFIFSPENAVWTWNTDTGELMGSPLYYNLVGRMPIIAYSPRNRCAISSSGAFSSTYTTSPSIQIWSSSQGGPFNQLDPAPDEVSSVAWSPDGNRIVSSHRTLVEPTSGSSSGCIFRIWDALNGSMVLAPQLSPPIDVSSVAYSPDGRFIASGLDNGQVIVCDAVSGSIVYKLDGFTEKQQTTQAPSCVTWKITRETDPSAWGFLLMVSSGHFVTTTGWKSGMRVQI
ncbi:hypothetical protein FRC07_012685 [Ceratobasidium sp. 392]|nr:hypothetical protein FRC07_012685 [Ceratobasidium sp. 392]